MTRTLLRRIGSFRQTNPLTAASPEETVNAEAVRGDSSHGSDNTSCVKMASVPDAAAAAVLGKGVESLSSCQLSSTCAVAPGEVNYDIAVIRRIHKLSELLAEQVRRNSLTSHFSSP